MTAPADPRTNPDIVGVCQIGEHKFCDGNQDIMVGRTVAVPLRCACSCHRVRAAPDSRVLPVADQAARG